MKKKIKYQPGGRFLLDLEALPPDSFVVLCPRCRSELLYAPDVEAANRLRIHPGFCCPRKGCNFFVTFHLSPPNPETDESSVESD